MSDAAPTPRSRGWRSYIGLTVGLVLLVGLTLAVGLHPVMAAAASVTLSGFLGVCGVWLGVLIILGLAWWLAAPDARPGGGWGFVWARTVREAASDVLPFSQVGGLVLGANAAAAATGLASAAIWASLVVDLTTEMAAQLLYTLGGVAGLGWRLTRQGGVMDPEAAGLLWGGLALLAAGGVVICGFVAVQRKGVGWVARIASRWLPGAAQGVESVQAELDRAYARRGRVVASTCVHGAGWVASGLVSWWMLRLMGTPLPLLNVLIIESLLYAAKSFGFAIPGALGVQEAAYTLIGPLFGLPPQTGIALSFLKRARDIAVGVPVLIAWRIAGARRLARLTAQAAACPDVRPAGR